MKSISRRTALAAVPCIAGGAMIGGAVAFVPSRDGELLRLVDEFFRLEAAIIAAPEDGSPELDRLGDAQSDVARAIAATPAYTTDGLAAKLRVYAVGYVGARLDWIYEDPEDLVIVSALRDANRMLDVKGGAA